jgi:hypothetical protein
MPTGYYEMNERTIGAMQPATSYVVRIDRTVQPGTVLQHLRRFVVHCFYDDSPNVDRKRNILLALFFSIVVVDNLLSKLQKNQDPDIDETVVEPVGAQHKRQYKNNK